jgi:putative membrane protein
MITRFLTQIDRVFTPLAGGFEDPRLRIRYLVASGMILFLFPFGLLFMVEGLLPLKFAWIVSVVILLSGLMTFISELRVGPPALSVLRFSALFIIFFAVLLVGVRTGYPFGSYMYTDGLRFSIIGVPLAMPVAWYAIVINAWRMSEVFIDTNRSAQLARSALIAGIMTVALDVVLEPMAAKVNYYWLWKWGTIPVQNYVSWCVLSAAAVWVLAATGRTIAEPDQAAVRGRQTNAFLLLGMQWILFSLTSLAHGFSLAVLVSAALLLLVWLTRSRTAPAFGTKTPDTP